MSFIRNLFIFICLFVTFSIYAQERDKPLKGEGAQAFLRRHNRDDKKDFQPFLDLNKGKFGKKNALLSGIYYVLPPKAEDPKKTNTQNKPNTPNKPNTQNKPVTQNIQDTVNESNVLDTLDITISETSDTSENSIQQPVINKNSKTGYEPLFGKKYAQYQIIDNQLEGACFFLVSGHGGPDPGAVATIVKTGQKLYEHEHAYDITLRLARKLLQHGATVYIIVQDKNDGIREGMYMNRSQKETLIGGEKLIAGRIWRQCAAKINKLSAGTKEKYQRAIFIHLDARGKGKIPDYSKRVEPYFMYYDNSPNSKNSERLAKTMRQTFANEYGKVREKNRPYSGESKPANDRARPVIKATKPVSVLVELGQVHNKNDQQRFTDGNRQLLAEWMAKGLIQDYKNSKGK